MSALFSEIAYELRWDLDHFEDYHILDWSYDLEMEPFPGIEKADMYDVKPFPHPSPVIFRAYPDIVNYIDYPYPENHWPVMSKRMYEALRSVGNFPHRVIPVAVVDWRVMRDKWRDKDGRLRDEITNWNYVAVQLTEFADVFDWEKSKYTPHERMPGRVEDVKEYVFKIPPGGLPPLFRIASDRVSLFISAEARAALKAAGVCGTTYMSLRGLQKGGIGREKDVPVVIPDGVL
jgi:hypothetical protein